MHLPTSAVFAAALFTVLGLGTKTEFNGDIVQGIPVITKLALGDVPVNAITRYYFLAGEAQGNIKYHVPVFVARGTPESLESGRRLSLSSTVHGDEYNGVRVIQKVFASLEEDVKCGKLNGTIIGVPVINQNGVMHNQRNCNIPPPLSGSECCFRSRQFFINPFPNLTLLSNPVFSSLENGFFTNLNRVFPGVDPNNASSAATQPEGYAYRIWTDLWGNTTNVDIAVDMHTLTTASDGPMWVYADYRQPYNERLATLTQADIIKIDPGEPGSIETEWVQNKIPAITLELGPGVSWNHDMITRGYDFVFRLLHDLYLLSSSKTTADGNDGDEPAPPITPDLSRTYIATNRVNIPATQPGWAQPLVGVLDDVAKGQELVRIYNTWGDVVEHVRAPDASRVLQIITDPPVEQGTVVVVLANNGTSAG